MTMKRRKTRHQHKVIKFKLLPDQVKILFELIGGCNFDITTHRNIITNDMIFLFAIQKSTNAHPILAKMEDHVKIYSTDIYVHVKMSIRGSTVKQVSFPFYINPIVFLYISSDYIITSGVLNASVLYTMWAHFIR